MEDANNETDLEINYNSEASNGDKRKREGKLRSKVWQHFTKIIKEDGRCDKCQCNHCQKLFTCSSRSGTTHLLRHITDGICPVFKKDKDKILPISYMRPGMDPRTGLLPWKFEQGLGQASAQQCMDVEVDYGAQTPSPLPLKTIEDEYGAHTPLPSRGKLPHSQPKGDRWMNEFKSCVAKHVELSNKLVELSNGKIPVNCPDYSGTALVKCLNELEDIAPSSDMYLDAFQILRDDDRERESFILLPPEARRRWLQRLLHQRHPLRYSLNV